MFYGIATTKLTHRHFFKVRINKIIAQIKQKDCSKVLYEILALTLRFDSHIIYCPKSRRHRATAIFQVVFQTLEDKTEIEKLRFEVCI